MLKRKKFLETQRLYENYGNLRCKNMSRHVEMFLTLVFVLNVVHVWLKPYSNEIPMPINMIKHT